MQVVLFVLGVCTSGTAIYLLEVVRSNKNKRQADKTIQDARTRAHEIEQEAQHRSDEIRKDAEKDKKESQAKILEERQTLAEERKKFQAAEDKIAQKEERIDQKIDELQKKGELLLERQKALESADQALDGKRRELESQLSKVAGMGVEEAKKVLFSKIEDTYERDFLSHIEKKKRELAVREKEICRELLINAMQQYGAGVTAETTQTTVELKEDEMKGRLIGKEGRNIIAFEKETGVSLIIDDTPNTVFISSFDLFRRYVAKKSLEMLTEDKRIQPARIEEVVRQNQAEAEKLIFQIGEQVLAEIGFTGLPQELVSIVGKLRFRTSYGQNIIKHSLEVAYIAEAIAKEIGADPKLALYGGFLHDIGKALDHDVEGTHPEVGGRILRKYGVDEKIVNIAEGHHGAVPMICVETKIVQLADAISAVRPGARRANADQYVKRLKEMEALILGFPGVTKAFALSAGREVRVFVDVDKIGDLQAEKLAQEIAQAIETNLNYPGEVKVNVIRERRFVEYAR